MHPQKTTLLQTKYLTYKRRYCVHNKDHSCVLLICICSSDLSYFEEVILCHTLKKYDKSLVIAFIAITRDLPGASQRGKWLGLYTGCAFNTMTTETHMKLPYTLWFQLIARLQRVYLNLLQLCWRNCPSHGMWQLQVQCVQLPKPTPPKAHFAGP